MWNRSCLCHLPGHRSGLCWTLKRQRRGSYLDLIIIGIIQEDQLKFLYLPVQQSPQKPTHGLLNCCEGTLDGSEQRKRKLRKPSKKMWLRLGPSNKDTNRTMGQLREQYLFIAIDCARHGEQRKGKLETPPSYRPTFSLFLWFTSKKKAPKKDPLLLKIRWSVTTVT